MLSPYSITFITFVLPQRTEILHLIATALNPSEATSAALFLAPLLLRTSNNILSQYFQQVNEPFEGSKKL
jgi:hypothetical protein